MKYKRGTSQPLLIQAEKKKHLLFIEVFTFGGHVTELNTNKE